MTEKENATPDVDALLTGSATAVATPEKEEPVKETPVVEEPAVASIPEGEKEVNAMDASSVADAVGTSLDSSDMMNSLLGGDEQVDLGDLEIEDSLSETDLNSINDEHYIFDGPTLFKTLNVISGLVKDSMSEVQRILYIIPGKGNVTMYMNLGEMIAKFTVPIENTKNAVSQPISLWYKEVFAAAKRNKSKMIIRCVGKNLYETTVLGGSFPLAHQAGLSTETHEEAKKLFEGVEYKDLDTKVIRDFTNKGSRVMVLARSAEERKFDFINGTGYFNSATAIAKFKGVNLEGTIGYSQLVVLHRMVDKATKVAQGITDDRIYFKSDNVEISYTHLYDPSVELDKTIEEADANYFNKDLGARFTVSTQQVYAASGMFKEIIGGSRTVFLETVDGGLYIKGTSEAGQKFNFKIATTDVQINKKAMLNNFISTILLYKDCQTIDVEYDSKTQMFKYISDTFQLLT